MPEIEAEMRTLPAATTLRELSRSQPGAVPGKEAEEDQAFEEHFDAAAPVSRTGFALASTADWNLGWVVVVASQVETWQRGFLSQGQAPGAIQQNLLRHQFTHYSLDISLAVIELQQLPTRIADRDNHAWVALDQLGEYGLPTPVKKLLASL